MEHNMLIPACIGKIHRATVTKADLNYIGSITIDRELLTASGIKPFQYVNITSLQNGTLWRTYVMPGEAKSGVICLNGPPARHFQPGDTVIIIAEALVTPEELEKIDPKVVFVDELNRVTSVERPRERNH